MENEIAKNVVQPKRRQRVVVVHGLQGNGWELTCHELLICHSQWFDLSRSLNPLAKPFFRLRKRFRRAKFSNIRKLKRHVPANIFLSSATFIALNSVLFFYSAILKLKLFKVQRFKAEGKLK